MRGRKPLPSNVVRLRGNPGKRRLNDAEPRPGAAVPACPAYLSDAARKEWKRLSRELASLGLLTRIDRGMLAAYCQAHALWVEAVQAIGRYGTMVKSPNGYPMQSPYVAVANKQVEIMCRIAAEFGMTPSCAVFDVREIAYDPWNATHIALRLEDEGATMIEFRQGFRSMSAPTRELEKLVVSRKLAHGGNPVTRWMASNVAVAQDPAGNLKPAKDKSTERIDGIVAIIMALGRAMVAQEEPQPSYQVFIF